MTRLALRFGRHSRCLPPAPGRSRSTLAAIAAALVATATVRAGDSESASRSVTEPGKVPARDPAGEEAGEVPRLANAPASSSIAPRPPHRPASPLDPIGEAKQAIADCREQFRDVKDYTCTLFKRERIDGRLTAQHVMRMKAKSEPLAIYVKFLQPNTGREAIYVSGRNKGRAWVHDVGLGKLLAGTLSLDPKSSMAMEDCRHPITEAGIGHLIAEVERAWAEELDPKESSVTIHRTAQVGDRPCTMIESVHPRKAEGFLFHAVKLYIDREHGLPIRFEAYDWPRHPGAAPELVEEYTFSDLRINVGLRDIDFDPANRQYSFGRF